MGNIVDTVKQSLIVCFSEGIGHKEGFFDTAVQAKQRNQFWPTLAQRNFNPGNLRVWASYPVNAGYAKFPGPDMPIDPSNKVWVDSCAMGWKALRTQCQRNIFDRNLTFLEFFAGKHNVYPGFAPSADKNDPTAYADFIVEYLKRHWIGFASKPEPTVESITRDIIVSTLVGIAAGR